ncbi:MAG: glycoside hydrolase family 88 protein [Terracidiphilus sp.]|nr:glycoside hydrolase family 88 protein [Terracidiphilus sp.]
MSGTPCELLRKAAVAAMERWPAGDTSEAGYAPLWSYTKATMLEGMEAAGEVTADPIYREYILKAVDRVVDEAGNLREFPQEPHSLDQILMGRQLLYAYRVTRQKRYAVAARRVMDELAVQPRNRAGGFWHKQIYPSQMWLDSAYMAEPFYAEFAVTFHDNETSAFEDIAHQFALLEKQLRDPRTGLLYHGWDESGQQAWADKRTGRSSQFWARSIGWFAMGLVDTLQYIPADQPAHKQLLSILNRVVPAILATQDAKSGVWWQIIDRPGAEGNYLEESASSMFVYVLAKGVRMNYLPAADALEARKGWEGIQRQFLSLGQDGAIHLNHIVRGAGLGGNPYRSGTYEYYVGERVVSDEPKGTGAFLLAASEAVRLIQAQPN